MGRPPYLPLGASQMSLLCAVRRQSAAQSVLAVDQPGAEGAGAIEGTAPEQSAAPVVDWKGELTLQARPFQVICCRAELCLTSVHTAICGEGVLILLLPVEGPGKAARMRVIEVQPVRAVTEDHIWIGWLSPASGS